ncbi:MAG: hypothetical protein ACD_81C00135G0005 [uncultured bacterium]|uniref:Uncharacterized protein n=1 Tax=Candidatus Wolfebacteria bacterium GW2011_GWE2_44_13 TaxID=1619017 RepID=A0A0G1JGS9_9BACT|nr:MAG: hypothetical protein ACD_81C00135G0005 [uncultured bacterium]KKT43207.1 MAG: hypothetical protein UW32_C0002G0068 [Candidatus Wolfebacteria bacterium GW2011_GWE2_44_13]
MNEFVEGSNKIIQYLFDKYVATLPALQTFALVVSGVLLFFVVMMMTKANVVGGKRDKFIDKWGLADMGKVKIGRAWKELLVSVSTGDSAKMKKAIGDADKILDEALKTLGFVGKNMNERLNTVDAVRLPNIKEVQEAHRISERIKKEPTFSLTQQEVWNIVGIYEKAFKEFGLFK